VWYGFGAGNTWADLVAGTDAALEAALESRNALADPQLVAISRGQTNALDPRPAQGGTAASGADFTYPLLQDVFFTPTTYRGAFSPDGPVWLAGQWSVLVTNGYLSGPATPAEGGPAGSSLSLGSVRPNPAAGVSAVEFSLPEAGSVRLSLFDVTGRELAVLVDSHLSSGSHSATLDATRLAPGVYVLRLTGDAGSATQRVVVAGR
jgi:hypothetical protein